MALSNVPTLTVLRHARIAKKISDGSEKRESRPHDTPIIDVEGPVLAAQALMLDLGMLESGMKDGQHRLLIVASPFIRCLQTATLVAQTIGVNAIQVHYGLTERVR